MGQEVSKGDKKGYSKLDSEPSCPPHDFYEASRTSESVIRVCRYCGISITTYTK